MMDDVLITPVVKSQICCNQKLHDQMWHESKRGRTGKNKNEFQPVIHDTALCYILADYLDKASQTTVLHALHIAA